MQPSRAKLDPTANRLLARVAPAELRELLDRAELMTLERHESLIEPNEPIRDVWFPTTSLASLVVLLSDGSTTESGSVGREGMVGVPTILAAGTTSMQTVTQVPGDAIRVPASLVKDLFQRGQTLHTLMNRYMHTLFVIASQSAACNARHQIQERLARWLLMSSDGIGSDDIAITHEYLATMLGVRRSGVTEAAQHLQEQGLIDYRRASVKIVDRERLERASCECYRAVRDEYERLLK